ncbi:MAG: allantoinase [Alphaproteobacteria bacterium]|nr:MAG: allantoinase [Alphaproteobacteria bacterium]
MLTWPDGRRLALSLVINVEEGAEMSVAEGDRKPEPVDELGVALSVPIRHYVNESNYAYGIRAGAPRILDLFARHRMPATVTAAALALERAPQLARRIVADGHEVAAHGWRWVHQFSMDETRERDFIRRAAESIAASCGQRPAGWLSRYLHTPNTRRLLAEEGFLYHMDDLSDDVPRWELPEGAPRPLVCVPYALDTNDMKFWTAPALTPQDWLDYARRSFDWLLAEARPEAPRMLSVGLHLRIIGRPGRIWALEAFLAHVAAAEGVWITTRRAIAERFAACCPWTG